jgi:glycosyltransferase involved in cell wall biosynthesis
LVFWNGSTSLEYEVQRPHSSVFEVLEAIMKLGVVYLARSADGSSKDFIKFAESYSRFSAGIEHELIIVLKGEARRAGTKLAANLMFADMNVRFLEISDDGFDIHAYLHASNILEHDFLCFLNTYSVICTDNWLHKLASPHLIDPCCGMTGATASYESLYDSYQLLTKLTWLTTNGHIGYDARLAEIFDEELSLQAPSWLEGADPASSSAQQGELKISEDIHAGAQQQWLEVTRSGAPLYGLHLFKPFPNPHLRTNAWVIKRELLNSFDIKLGFNKIECCHFESGQFGLPTLLAERGLKQLLVGANGEVYEVQNWTKSKGFRLENQENIIVRDNQVDVFDQAPPSRRAHLSALSWGRYLAGPPAAVQEIGFPFNRGVLELSKGTRSRPQKQEQLKISIVIPTRNRRDLVMEALHTIIRQTYTNWECVVFDNCSEEPVEELVRGLNDSRIKVVRSEEFLPVTDSWNKAIDLATGDYVCLLGDDDGLVPIYADSIAFIAEVHDRPDFVYSGLFQFFHPGVAPWEPSGYVSDLRYAPFFAGEPDIFRLDLARAHQAVYGSLQLKRSFTFNMQAFSFERSFLDSIRADGKIFHSPFPDYYLANIAFALGKKITIAPKPIAVAGVSKKSFGFTLFNNMEKKGADLLATKLENDSLFEEFKDVILPGPAYNTNYYVTMLHVRTRLGAFSPSEVNTERYRRLQILSSLLPDPSATSLNEPSRELLERLTNEEIAWIGELRDMIEQAASDKSKQNDLIELHAFHQMHSDTPPVHVNLDTGSYADLPSLFDSISEGRLTASIV